MHAFPFSIATRRRLLKASLVSAVFAGSVIASNGCYKEKDDDDTAKTSQAGGKRR